MFTNVSLTGTGIIIFLISAGLEYFGIVVDENIVANAVNGFVSVLAFATIIVGQLRRSDLSFGFWRE
jgi:uncharacterized membrane protein